MFASNDWRWQNHTRQAAGTEDYEIASERVNERELYHNLIRTEGMEPSGSIFERFFVVHSRGSQSPPTSRPSSPFETTPLLEDARLYTDSDIDAALSGRLSYYSTASLKGSSTMRLIDCLAFLIASVALLGTGVLFSCTSIILMGGDLATLAQFSPYILTLIPCAAWCVFVGLILWQMWDGDEFRESVGSAFSMTEMLLAYFMTLVFAMALAWMILFWRRGPVTMFGRGWVG